MDLTNWLQMKWMESFLEEGQLAGKIICPNKKCSAKLGNYDWAGVCCGCKEWVIPVREQEVCRESLLTPRLFSRDFVLTDLKLTRLYDIFTQWTEHLYYIRRKYLSDQAP